MGQISPWPNLPKAHGPNGNFELRDYDCGRVSSASWTCVTSPSLVVLRHVTRFVRFDDLALPQLALVSPIGHAKHFPF
jgi:hypothetical protein